MSGGGLKGGLGCIGIIAVCIFAFLITFGAVIGGASLIGAYVFPPQQGKPHAAGK